MRGEKIDEAGGGVIGLVDEGERGGGRVGEDGGGGTEEGDALVEKGNGFGGGGAEYLGNGVFGAGRPEGWGGYGMAYECAYL